MLSAQRVKAVNTACFMPRHLRHTDKIPKNFGSYSFFFLMMILHNPKCIQNRQGVWYWLTDCVDCASIKQSRYLQIQCKVSPLKENEIQSSPRLTPLPRAEVHLGTCQACDRTWAWSPMLHRNKQAAYSQDEPRCTASHVPSPWTAWKAAGMS